MSVNGTDNCWRFTGRIFSAEDLRRGYQGQTVLVVADTTIVTPLALDELRSRAVRLVREASGGRQAPVDATACWGLVNCTSDAAVDNAVRAVARELASLRTLDSTTGLSAAWLRDLGNRLGSGQWIGCLVVSGNALLLAAAANRLSGLRAAVVRSVADTKRALKTLGANVLAIDWPGPTYFELRHMLKTAATATPSCPPEAARLLQELESHAHR